MLLNFEKYLINFLNMCLELKLIRHMWEASLPDVGLSKSVKQKPKSMSQSGQYLLIGD